MADDWDMPLGADASSFSSKQCKYDTWDDDYDSIHNTGKSIQNVPKSFQNTNDNESDGWMSAKSKSSKGKQSARSSWKDVKQEFSKGKRNASKHSQQKSRARNNSQASGDSWNTYESNNRTSNDWHFADNSKYAQAPAPVANVWEERMKRSEAIRSMEPTNETEEEAMIRHAIELSRLEAERDEDNQKKLAKEYELQMQLLASNPEMVESVSEALEEHTSPTSHSTFKNDAIMDQESSHYEHEYDPLPKHREYNRNGENPVRDKNEMKNLPYGGAKPKLNKIIDSFGGWGIKENVSDYAKEASESNDGWNEPDRNSHSDKMAKTNTSFENNMLESPKKQPKGKKKGKGDVESDFTFFPAEKAESSHSLDDREENGNSPGHTKMNHKVSDHDSKVVTEFDDFMQELRRDSVEVASENEVNSENDVVWEDKKSVQCSDSKWEKNLADSSNVPNDKSEKYDLFSCSFNALSINSDNKPDKYEDQSSCSLPAASNQTHSTCNTNDLLCSNSNIAADQNPISNEIQNSPRYGDFQTNIKTNETIAEKEEDIYNPFTSKMPSIPKQTLLEENDHIQSHQTFRPPADSFVPVGENPTAVHHNPTLNPSSFIMPNLSLGAPVMPVPMPLGAYSPTFMSPYVSPVVMQQLLMLNNPFFVKQLQVLDMYYRSAGTPCSGIPFSPAQVPQAHNPLHDAVFLASQNQVPPESEQNFSHTFPFSNENKVPERASVVPNPPGLNNFMQARNRIDTLEQAEINSFLDKYCDNDFEDEVPPIPPPKPATAKCDDPSIHSSALEVTSRNQFYNENQKNRDPTPASATIREDVVSHSVNQNAINEEHNGWGDLNNSSVKQQKQSSWDEEVDGWGNESATPFAKNAPNMETRRPTYRQPSSQPIAGRYKR